MKVLDDTPESPDKHSTVLLRLLAERHKKLHFISTLELSKLTAPHHRVHVEEDALSIALTLPSAGDEPILKEGIGNRDGNKPRKKGHSRKELMQV